MFVGIDVVERQAAGPKGLELRADLSSQLISDFRQKEEPDPGSDQIAVEFAIAADQRRDLSGGQYRAAIDQHEMQSDSEPRQQPGTRCRIRCCRRTDHQARGRQDPVPMRFLDSLVDGRVEPEIVGAEDQPLQPAISRLRRK
jgi:hypothetical protein